MNCELCGASGDLFKALIENSQLNVCEKCSRFGKVIGRLATAEKKEERPAPIPKPEKTFTITEGFGNSIRKKREHMGLSQKEFAKKISEKESIIHKIEVEAIEPNLELAKKLEKALGIQLLEEANEEEAHFSKQKSQELTFGDLVKVKKR